MIDSLQDFINNHKSIPDGNTNYIGLGRKELTSTMNNLMNGAAKDFLKILVQSPSARAYQEKIKIGLKRFSPYYNQLDTEDRERVCIYFERLIDIVKPESSDGLLNEWLYRFNPQ